MPDWETRRRASHTVKSSNTFIEYLIDLSKFPRKRDLFICKPHALGVASVCIVMSGIGVPRRCGKTLSVLYLHIRILRFMGILIIVSGEAVECILNMSLVVGKINLNVLSHIPTQLARPWMLWIVFFLQ